MTHVLEDTGPVLRSTGCAARPSSVEPASGTGVTATATVRFTTTIKPRSGTDAAQAVDSGAGRAGAALDRERGQYAALRACRRNILEGDRKAIIEPQDRSF